MIDATRDKGRKALFFKRNKELLTFLLFLVFAVFAWLVHNMQREIETEINVPVRYAALPSEAEAGNDLPQSIQVTIRDNGTALYGYAFTHIFDHGFLTIDIDLMQWKNHDGTARIPRASLEKKISDFLKPSTEILGMSPDTLKVLILEKERKEVPVRLVSSIVLPKQYMLTGEPEINPARISIYAPREKLKNIDCIETELLTVDDLRDSITTSVSLKSIDGIQFSQDEIEVSLHAAPFTEASISIPITGMNVPRGFQMRTFPSTANVTFLVFESKYNLISPEDFHLQVNYEEGDNEADNALQEVVLTKCPPYAIRPQVSPDRVESLIEKTSSK